MGFQSKRYRPELHYMRGPGPKWHEKNTAPVSLISARGLPLPRSGWAIVATVILMVAVTALALP